MRSLLERLECGDRSELSEGKKTDVIAAFRKIVKEHQRANVQGVMVDAYSASAAIQIYDALSPENQRKMASLPVKKMLDVVWKLVGKSG